MLWSQTEVGSKEADQRSNLTPKGTAQSHLLATTSSSFRSVTPSEESLSDKWCPTKLKASDRALQLLRQAEVRPALRSTTLRDVFFDTKLPCTARQPVETVHTCYAYHSGSEVSSMTDLPSRKQAVLDAAAGFELGGMGMEDMDDISESISPVLRLQGIRDAISRDTDLISFD
jgi:hypothetical protein